MVPKKAPRWMRGGRVSPEVRAGALAALVAGAMVLVAVVILGPPGSGTGAKETYVVATSEGERLLLTFLDVSVGSVKRSDDTEAIRWSELSPSPGRVEIADGRTGIAAGPVSDDGLVVAQMRFGLAGYVVGGALYELPIPQDTLRLVIPGPPGKPGDTLLLTFDADRSIANDNGLLTFRPFVSRAAWLSHAGGEEPALTNGMGPENSLFSWDDLNGDDDGDDGSSGGGNGGGGNGGGGGSSPKDVGRVHVYVRDAAIEVIESLNVTFQKVGIGTDDRVTTYFEGQTTIDLRKYAGPADRAALAQMQVPAGPYNILQFQFSAADGRINGQQTQLAVPQPILVLERGFVVPPGATIEFLVDFQLTESVTAGVGGFEFRPVVFQLQASDTDTDGDGTPDTLDPDDDNDNEPDSTDLDRDGDGQLDRRPAQYRTGGSRMPALGAAGGPAQAAEEADQSGTLETISDTLDDEDGQTRPLDDVIDDVLPDLPGP